MEENYGDGVSDRIAKPQRDKDGVLLRQNMRVNNRTGHYHYYATILKILMFSSVGWFYFS
jgi:hypothetical protein